MKITIIILIILQIKLLQINNEKNKLFILIRLSRFDSSGCRGSKLSDAPQSMPMKCKQHDSWS